MLHLARAALQNPQQAVVFIDPHGDAVKQLLPLVPEERAYFI